MGKDDNKGGANQLIGNGVIILLHGVPGVGKTSTAGKGWI